MYEIRETLEAMNDLTNLAIYIYGEFGDEQSAEMIIDAYSDQLEILEIFPNAYNGTGFMYRNYLIRKCPCGKTNIFYVVNEERKQVVILRILHSLQDWVHQLRRNKRYHYVK